jgi:hypothetical protein
MLGSEALFDLLKLRFDTGINGAQTGFDETATTTDACIALYCERLDISSRVP